MHAEWTVFDPPLCKSEFNKRFPEDTAVGLLIRMEAYEGRCDEYLVGHINPNGGPCDCCDIINENRIVAARRVWTPEEPSRT